MSPEEWKAHIQQWQQSGGRSSKTPAAKADPPADADGGGYLGSALAFGKGMLREGASQIGVAKDFAEGSDPEHETAEWLGRSATDIAPSVALDLAAPEIGIVPTAMRGAKYIRPLVNSAIKGWVGGGMANPRDRNQGAQTGAEVGVGGSMIGSALHSPVARSTLLPLVILAEMAQRGGMIPNEILPLAYPWAMAHAISALGGLAQFAGKAIPATTGAIGSQIEQGINQSQ
jgi:hypothetical protein